MSTDAKALRLICDFEGYLRPLKDGTDRVRPYLCPAGVPTIGYGSIWWLDGTKVTMDAEPITRAQAEALMDHELKVKCEPAVAQVKVRLHPLMRGALISFIYNCGSGAFKASNLKRAVNDQRWNDVPKELSKWRLGGGRVLPGLIRRRTAEAALFMEGVRLLAAPEPANRWITDVLARAA